MYFANKMIILFISESLVIQNLYQKYKNNLKVGAESNHILRCIINISNQQIYFANHVFLVCIVLILYVKIFQLC